VAVPIAPLLLSHTCLQVYVGVQYMRAYVYMCVCAYLYMCICAYLCMCMFVYVCVQGVPCSLGVSAVRGFDVNSLAVPRKAKEAIGGLRGSCTWTVSEGEGGGRGGGGGTE